MTLDPELAALLAVVGTAVGVLGLLVALVATVRLARLNRSYKFLAVAEGRENFVDVVARTRSDMAEVIGELNDLGKRLVLTRSELSRALRYVAVVRYDAYGDLAGRYSFSAAMLDDVDNGLIMTSIHGRTETRLYLKGVSRGKPDIPLSPEEEQAVKKAKGGRL